ncbi:unnamed protein product [Caenorhabditis auriculariae]|uniref:Uncharacterized protein n=1 Tax=Caenorhabditis auriculariae TaxID=2777116 RepID=A0A8S1H8X4_9PELO|nr:unnamed protein product [Caenorhabditis auriculariae]
MEEPFRKRKPAEQLHLFLIEQNQRSMNGKNRRPALRNKMGRCRSNTPERRNRCVAMNKESGSTVVLEKLSGTIARKKTSSREREHPNHSTDSSEKKTKMTVKRTPSDHQTTGASNQPPAAQSVVRSPDLPPTPDDLKKNQNK